MRRGNTSTGTRKTLDKEPEEAEMPRMTLNIKNLKGNPNKERWTSLHYGTTCLLENTPKCLQKLRKGWGFSPTDQATI